ncbi:MAG: hypothetical protein ACP5QA_10485 [Phycisphaerae bacterium]
MTKLDKPTDAKSDFDVSGLADQIPAGISCFPAVYHAYWLGVARKAVFNLNCQALGAATVEARKQFERMRDEEYEHAETLLAHLLAVLAQDRT